MSPPAAAFAAALAGLDGVWPGRLGALLARFGGPEPAWDAVLGGHPDARPDPRPAVVARRRAAMRAGLPAPDDTAAWQRQARRTSVEALWSRCAELGVAVWVHGAPGYPVELAGDLDPPPVLFGRGDPAVLDGLRVAVVGTRNATGPGRRLAAALGAELAGVGVRVVSGLALGIDGAAHRGALHAARAPVVGVVAAGLDVAYPPQHRRLHAEVAQRGLLLSEVPPGTAPAPWRFPLRNRVISALADTLVVVESRARGGSMHTVREAQRRGVDVMAVPGSPLSPAAAGTNRLISEGAAPVLDVLDVVVALGLAGRAARRVERRPRPDDGDQAVLDCFGGGALHLDAVVALTGLDVVSAALALGRLEAAGWLARSGAWFEPIGPVPP